MIRPIFRSHAAASRGPSELDRAHPRDRLADVPAASMRGLEVALAFAALGFAVLLALAR